MQQYPNLHNPFKRHLRALCSVQLFTYLLRLLKNFLFFVKIAHKHIFKNAHVILKNTKKDTNISADVLRLPRLQI